MFSRAARVTFSLAATRKPIWNLVVSNVPGPQFPLYCAGARLVANYPVSVITDGMGLNITVMSYYGHLDFGIVADREQMRDVWKLIDWLELNRCDELLPRAPRLRCRGRRPETGRYPRVVTGIWGTTARVVTAGPAVTPKSYSMIRNTPRMNGWIRQKNV